MGPQCAPRTETGVEAGNDPAPGRKEGKEEKAGELGLRREEQGRRHL
jgi:hypothetical protein